MQIKISTPDQAQLKELGIENWVLWECEPSEFDWEYNIQETAYVQEGHVTVSTQTGQTEIKAGDLVTFPSGLKCKWKVHSKIRKVYTFDD